MNIWKIPCNRVPTGYAWKRDFTKIKEKYQIYALGREGASPSFNYKTEDGYEFGLIDPHNMTFRETVIELDLTAEGF